MNTLEQNNNNLEVLAEVAFDAENFELAYDYYNRLLEQSIENHLFWIRKAYCAANLSSFDKMLDKEIISCMNSAFKLYAFQDDEIIGVANNISTIIYNKIIDGVKFIQDEIEKKFNALQIPAGTLYAVNNLRKLSIQQEVWGHYSEKLFQYFKVMDYVVRLKTTPITCEKGYRSVNYTTLVAKNSGGNFFNLESNHSEILFLKSLMQFSKFELNKLQPNNTITNPKKSSDCFIATATMGDYNHPVVIDLRFFRDNWLIKKKWGKSFIKWYYKNGPKGALVIEKSLLIRKLSYLIVVKPLHIIAKSLITK